jgi:anaphase-promoting complex subunit 6
MQLAKESLMEALMIDVKNYDAFRELVEGGVLSSKEGKLLSSCVWA